MSAETCMREWIRNGAAEIRPRQKWERRMRSPVRQRRGRGMLSENGLTWGRSEQLSTTSLVEAEAG